MSRDAGEILKEALALPPEARAALADHLWDSLDEEVDANAEEAWRQEIKHRIDDLDSWESRRDTFWSEARARLLCQASDMKSRQVEIHPDALVEAEAAVAWYAERSSTCSCRLH